MRVQACSLVRCLRKYIFRNRRDRYVGKRRDHGFPHPPLIIPEVGRGREREIQTTIDAYHSAARKLASWQPDTVVVLSPHSVMYMDYFHISPEQRQKEISDSLAAPQVKIKVSYDTEFVELLSGRPRIERSRQELWGREPRSLIMGL